MNDQTISHSQESDMATKYREYMISDQHSSTIAGESLSVILDSLSL
jgi:hypothetical protein